MQVIGSPFKVMKILSEGFGYSIPVCPIEGDLSTVLDLTDRELFEGLVQSDAGD